MKWLSSLLFVCFSVQGFDHFITRHGSTLFDGEQVFRFAGIHAPELHRIEDDALGKCAADPRGWGQYFKWPTAEEQENWIKSLVRTGHKTMRIYTLSVEEKSDNLCARETHILAPDKPGQMPVLNEKAMQVYDRMIAIADKQGLRLILPFIDHWEWWGGRKQLAAFYNEKEDDFYNINSQTYAAYQHIIRQVISRKNSLTGRIYAQEKAIMAWETGNELKLTNKAFLEATVDLIEQLAPNQLIVDGTYLKINEFALSHPDVDIISNHFYTVNGNNKPETIKSDLAAINGRKAYFVGEFGLVDAPLLDKIMQTAVEYEHKGTKAVGAFVWGFRGRRHNGGFYFHQEYTGHYSYRLPGFAEASENQELEVVDIVRKAQAQMHGLMQAEPLPVPEPPKLRVINWVQDIRWMGSPVGRYYRIERAEKENGPWTTVAEKVSDGKQVFNPASDKLFGDTDKLVTGKTYYYRVFAENESGQSGPSNIQSVIYSKP